MFVVSAGMSRGGSTWLFNAARLMLGSGAADLYAAWVDDLDPGRAAVGSAVLVKTHDPSPDLARRATATLTTHRDLRDIAVSLRGMGWANGAAELLQAVTHARRCHDYWAPRSHLDLPYESLLNTPLKALDDVGKVLGARLSQAETVELGNRLSAMEGPAAGGTYDPKTLLHPGHRQDGRAGRWLDELEPQLVEAINAEHGDWLQRHGYPI